MNIRLFNHPEWETAKRLLCAIIQEAGGQLDSQVRLYKAFYWAHLAYYQRFEGMLSDYPMARMPQGPGIDRGEDLLFELQASGLLQVSERPIPGMNPERTFKLTAGFVVNVTPEEREAIRDGLKKIEGKTAREVSDETHQTSRAWNRKRNGQILNIYEDLLSQEQFETAKSADAEAKALLDEVLR